MITVKQTRDIAHSKTIYEVEVPDRDVIEIDLDRIDLLQLSEPAHTAADVLLDLHTLAFRQQQQFKATKENKKEEKNT